MNTNDEHLDEILASIKVKKIRTRRWDMQNIWKVDKHTSNEAKSKLIAWRQEAVISELEKWLPVATMWSEDEGIHNPLNMLRDRIAALKKGII